MLLELARQFERDKPEMIIELGEDEKGRVVKAIGNPVQLSDTPARVRLFPPRLGEHTDEVLQHIAPAGRAQPGSSAGQEVEA